MANQYKNKVVYNGTILLDLSTDTVTLPEHIMAGFVGHLADGTRVTGTGSGGGGSATLITKTITANGTYNAEDDNADGYSSVTVDVPPSGITPTGSINITTNGTHDVTNYASAVVSVNGSGTPSATQHTILFEFTDETSATITAYYDSSFIGDAIRATTPTEYGGKTVDSASLDGVAWYTKPVGSWETIFDDNANLEADTPYPYFWITELSDVEIPMGSVWRITFDGTPYVCTVTTTTGGRGGCIGNPLYSSGGADDGSGVPLCLYHTPWGAWSGAADASAGSHTLKVERQVLS